MFYKILLTFLIITTFISNIYSKNICYVMESFIRPYKKLIDIVDINLKNTTFIVKRRNFWKIKSCDIIIAFGEETSKVLRNEFYNKDKKYIYTFIGFRNSLENLKNNEQVYYMQPDPEFIFKKVHNIIPYANKWIVFYSKELQKEYLETANKFSSYYRIKINPVFASEKINLNKVITNSDYNLFWFIPDPVYSTTYLINYILEKLIILKKFSVGFNEFFYKSGATISFKIDYEKTASLIYNNLNPFRPGYFPFKYKILINKKNLRFLKSEFNKKD